ncbi:MAG: hypothetical protein LCH52_05405 [Bacteroidetes bacterium]|nr:hypothetical protein [Bacteroidota bacterium]
MSILKATGQIPGGSPSSPMKLLYYISFSDPWSSDLEADLLEASSFSYGGDDTDIISIMPGNYTFKVRIADKTLYSDYVNLFSGYDARVSVRFYTGTSYTVIHHSKVDKYNVIYTDFEQTIEVKVYDLMALMKEWDPDWNTTYMGILPNTLNGRAWVDPAIGDENVWINITRFLNDLINRTELPGTVTGPGYKDYDLTRTFISATGYMPPSDFITQDSGAGIISWLYVPIVNFFNGAFKNYKDVIKSLMITLCSGLVVYRGKAYLLPMYYRGYSAGGVIDIVTTIYKHNYLSLPETKFKKPIKALKVHEMNETGATSFDGYDFYPDEETWNIADSSDQRDLYIATPCSPTDMVSYLGTSLSKNLAAWYSGDANDLVRRVRTDSIKFYVNGAYTGANNFWNHSKTILYNLLSQNKRTVRLTVSGLNYPPYKYYQLEHDPSRTYRILNSKEDFFENVTELELVEC